MHVRLLKFRGLDMSGPNKALDLSRHSKEQRYRSLLKVGVGAQKKQAFSPEAKRLLIEERKVRLLLCFF